MKLGSHFFKGYEINITADTKPEDVAWVIKRHPEFAKVIDYNIEDSGQSSKAKPKQGKRSK